MENIDRVEISKKIISGQPVILTFNNLTEELLMTFNSILARMLAKMDHVFLLNSLITIMREIIVNALKANAKRIYFKKIGLDITSESDYTEGMEKFKDNVIGDFDVIRNDLEHSDYYIKVNFSLDKNSLSLIVQNNAPILPEELKRIQFRISKAIQYNDFSEAYSEIEDSLEGAGLGIVLTILFLKNMGIDPNGYKIQSNEKITQTSVSIPAQLKPMEMVTQVKQKILEEIEGIPTFPENIIELQALCNDPNAQIEVIAKKIMLDPALSTDVIKLSNSAGFLPGKRIENVSNAIMTIGLKNVNAILVASNARRILNDRYSSFEQIWEHCNKTAFYSRNIALQLGKSKVVENAFMAGLLHDLGKIILLATDLRLVKTIAEIVKERKIASSTVMEEISIGISHSAIGGMIAHNWNFPPYLVEAIKYHHAPLNATDEFKDLVNIVYLSNMLCGIEDRKYSYYYIDEGVLEGYDLFDIAKFNDFHEKLKAKYKTTRTGSF